MKRYLAFGTLALLALAALTGGYTRGGISASADRTNNLFGIEPNAPNHTFPASVYVQPRTFTKKAGSVLLFDDGDTSFVTMFVPISDSICAARGDSVRVRGTVLVVPSLVGVGALSMTVDQVRSLDSRQDIFEIGSHGEDAERLGGRGLDGSGNRVAANGVTGMSYEFVDAHLSANQDSAAAWGIQAFRSHGFANWRRTGAIGDLFLKNGYFQAKGMAIDADMDTSHALPNETSAMALNTDPFAPAFCGKGASFKWKGFQRPGLMLDPFNIGARASFDTATADVNGAGVGTPDTCKAHVSVAVQSGTISMLTLHRIRVTRGTDNLAITRAELISLMDHIANLVQAGVLESLTFEQTTARMRGIPTGDMMPTYGFKKISDITTSHVSGLDDEPIGFALAGGAVPSFYSSVLDTLGAGATQWKVHSQAVLDTVIAEFVDRDADSLEATHGLSSRTGNILIQRGPAASNGTGLSRTYTVSGAKGKYLDINVQVMVTNTTSANGYLSCKAGAFSHRWEDFVNGGAAAFAMLPRVLGARNAGIDTTNIPADRQAVRPQFVIAYADTATTGAHVTATSNFTSVFTRTFWWGEPSLAAYVLHDKTAAAMWDHVASFGNETDIDGAGGAGQTHMSNLPLFTKAGEPEDYTFRVPINERTDYVQAVFSVERIGTDFGATPEIFVLAMNSSVVR